MSESDVYEINLLQIVRELWKKRFFILIISVLFVCFGILLFSYKKTVPVYTAKSSLVLQQGNLHMSGYFPNTANCMNSQGYNSAPIGLLPMTIYPKMVQNVSFLKKLMVKNVNVSGNSVVLMDLCTNGKNNTRQEEYTAPNTQIDHFGRENECIGILRNSIHVAVDQKSIIDISVTMPEPMIAAQVVREVQELLQQELRDVQKKMLEESMFIIKNQLDSVDSQIAELETNTVSLGQERQILTDLRHELQEKLIRTTILSKEIELSLVEVVPVAFPLAVSNVSTGLLTYIILFAILGILISVCLVFIIPFTLSLSHAGRITDWISKKWN